MLKVYVTHNNFANKKKKYSFRSTTTETMSQNQLIDAIANANTTVTKADTIAVMSELQEQFDKAIKNGKSVTLFMGTFTASASGTAESHTETFKPGNYKDKRTPKRDHKISLIFKPARIYADELSSIQFERIGLTLLCEPQLFYTYNGTDRENNEFAPGDFITLRGSYIKVDSSDSTTGVFLINRAARQTIRASVYTRATRLTICAQIPPETVPGQYSVCIKTKKQKKSNELSITVLQTASPD
jgi:hypothetical protein